MTLTFITNFINHHQVPVADVFYQILGQDYTFIATIAMPESVKKSGYPDFSKKPYLLKAYENKESYNQAMILAEKSDVVIIGAASYDFILKRIAQNRATFIYSERWFRDGFYSLLSPRVWWFLLNNHIKYRNKSLFMLCASAYASFDVSLVGAYPNKCFKWGYFTKIENLDMRDILNQRSDKDIQILWVARFLKLKHPELPVRLAKELKNKGYRFHIKMAGTGAFLESTDLLIKELGVQDCVSLIGNMPNDKILSLMRESNIFIFTSDKKEGWGAVLNEAMGNGCAVVASNMIGSAPYLIKHGENGYMFKSGNIKDLTLKVEDLINNPELRNAFSQKAYNTLKTEWSPINAAQRFLLLSESIIKGETAIFGEGPCSRAERCCYYKV